MKKGQDVELHLRWGGANFENQGHTVAIVGMTKETKADGTVEYGMTRLDDGDQDSPGSNNRKFDGRLEHRDTDMDGTLDTVFYVYSYRPGTSKTAKVVGWIAESPTKAIINKAITDKADALRLAVEALAGSADDAQSDELLRQACKLDYLARRLLEHVDCDPDATAAQKSKALDLAAEAKDVKDSAQAVKAEVGMPLLQADALNTLLNDAAELTDLSVELRGLYPPDADFDDVPDSSDNAPNAANFDQFDCNNDGIGDVIQLEGNDGNDNGILDDCEAGDVDGDLDTDLDDYRLLQQCFGAIVIPGEHCSNADLNGDGVVNELDLTILVVNLTGPF